MSDNLRYAILGAGNLGEALLGGMLARGVASPEQIVITVKSREHAHKLEQRHGVRTMLAANNLDAAQFADVVILGVKPRILADVLRQVRWGFKQHKILVSMAAAVPMAEIESLLGLAPPLFRAMPNLAMLTGESATCLCANAAAGEAHWKIVLDLFRSVGTVAEVRESDLDIATALSGGGPAYVAVIIEGLVMGALKMGLPRIVAEQLAVQTVLGSAALIRASGTHPAILRDQVVTPGGTTIAALVQLERAGIRATMMAAVEAATLRCRELGGEIVADLESEQHGSSH